MTQRDRSRTLKNMIMVYEAMANPTPEETQEYEEAKKELAWLLSQLEPAEYETSLVDHKDGFSLFVVIRGPRRGKFYRTKFP